MDAFSYVSSFLLTSAAAFSANSQIDFVHNWMLRTAFWMPDADSEWCWAVAVF